MKQSFYRYSILTALLLTGILMLFGCNPAVPQEPASDTPAVPETAAPAIPDAPPSVESYPFAVMLDSGEEITVDLPTDPELSAELHLCAFTGVETPARVVLYNAIGDMEEARIFSGDDGAEYPVVTPGEILDRYVTFTDSTDAWLMTVSGAEYQIPKAQFADTEANLLPLPNPAELQNFYVENGQLFCRVSFQCASDAEITAAETLKIRYDLTDGTVTAAEITFERPVIEEVEETP